MFPREQRLHTSNEVVHVLRKGLKRSNGVVSCYFLAKPGRLRRVAVVVDSKVSKKAVERNLIKRRVRALLRELPFPEGELLVRVWKGGTALSYEELKMQLRQCLKTL